MLKKKISAGLASLALAAGFVAVATPAHADTDMIADLCQLNEQGEAAVNCSISGPSEAVEGDTVDVEVRGQEGVTIEVALFAATLNDDGETVLVRFDDTVVEVEVEEGGTTVEMALPEIRTQFGNSLEGGRDYFITVADQPLDSLEMFSNLRERVLLHSARPTLQGLATGSGTEEQPFSLDLIGGLPGDRIKVQAYLGEEDGWVDFATVSNDELNEDGAINGLEVVSPEVEQGTYPVRFYNITRDVPGAENRYELRFGVAPEPTPSPTPTPTTTPDPTATPEPTVTPDPTPTAQPTGGARPGLPSTGVNA